MIGVGSMGAAACYTIASRGYSVLGLEQFTIPHTHGSHSGQSRIIRKAYFEHPAYVPLLQRSYQLWKRFEDECQEQLFFKTGIIYFGKNQTQTLNAIAHSAVTYNIEIKTPSLAEALALFPAFHIPANFDAIIEPDAGFVLPEKTISLYASRAIEHGATIHTGEAVTGWTYDNSLVKVQTATALYTCEKLVITAGPWSAKMIPGWNHQLKVTEQTLAWINVGVPEKFSMGNFPCWFIDDPDMGIFYGFPILPPGKIDGPVGLKLAHHIHGEETDPDNRKNIHSEKCLEPIMYVLEKYLPEALGEVNFTQQCLYSNSADEHFIIDHLPGYNGQVVVASGFSGHGFKFVPVVGEILADLAIDGSTRLPITFLNLERFNPKQ